MQTTARYYKEFRQVLNQLTQYAVFSFIEAEKAYGLYAEHCIKIERTHAELDPETERDLLFFIMKERALEKLRSLKQDNARSYSEMQDFYLANPTNQDVNNETKIKAIQDHKRYGRTFWYDKFRQDNPRSKALEVELA